MLSDVFCMCWQGISFSSPKSRLCMTWLMTLKGGQGLLSVYGCIAVAPRVEPIDMGTEAQCTEKSWGTIMNNAGRQRAIV